MALRVNPNLVKIHRCYAVSELAARFGVHKNTVRHWQRIGLAPIDGGRPVLFHGAEVRQFLVERNTRRKRPCPPGTIYCFRCREPRRPALGMVDYVDAGSGCGNLQALCEVCGAVMHRRANRSALPTVMPNVSIQFREGQSSLVGRCAPSLNCDLERQGRE